MALTLSQDPCGRHWGYDLSRRAGVRSGVLYPILDRMLAEGWLEDGWEKPEEIEGGRPRRRYYKLTDHGRHEIGGVRTRAADDPRFRLVLGSSVRWT